MKQLNGSQEIDKHIIKETVHKSLKTAPLGRVTGAKAILCILTTTKIPSWVPCKVSKQKYLLTPI